MAIAQTPFYVRESDVVDRDSIFSLLLNFCLLIRASFCALMRTDSSYDGAAMGCPFLGRRMSSTYIVQPFWSNKSLCLHNTFD